MQVGKSARDQLRLIHAAAAERNDRVGLFASRERFPGVFERRLGLAECEGALERLLPTLSKRLRIPQLEFKSVQNQGDYLVEVDVHRTDIPKVRVSIPIPLWFVASLFTRGSFPVKFKLVSGLVGSNTSSFTLYRNRDPRL